MDIVLKVAFAGGGTGGHLYPALNLAEAMKEKWRVHITFFGTENGIEAEKVPSAGYDLIRIPVAGFHRRITLKNLTFPVKLWQSIRLSKQNLKKIQPDFIIGTGGYVMGPVLHAASKMGIPFILQEQNSYPGVTTRMLAEKAQMIFTAYEETQNFFKNDNVVICGNPIKRAESKGDKAAIFKKFHLDDKKNVVLVFGGSQGSANINSAVSELLLSGGLPEGYQMLWQTGSGEYSKYDKWIGENNINDAVVTAFIDPMHEAYNLADFAICRAGAMTLSELMAYRIPALLIPLPHAAADHQYKNAMAVKKKGGAVVIRDNEDLVRNLGEAIKSIVSGQIELKKMSRSLEMMAGDDAIDCILQHIDRWIHSGKVKIEAVN